MINIAKGRRGYCKKGRGYVRMCHNQKKSLVEFMGKRMPLKFAKKGLKP